jgi:hypothetical protein
VLVMGCAAGAGWLAGGMWSVVVTMALAVPALEAGYLAGVFLRSYVKEIRKFERSSGTKIDR